MVTKKIKFVVMFYMLTLIAACYNGASYKDKIPPSTNGLASQGDIPKNEVELGRLLFHDVNLSRNRTQSCATCHDPQHAFIDSRDNEAQRLGVSLGDDNISIGFRNAPTISYAKFSPTFSALPDYAPKDDNGFIGGQFLDGRAADLAAQAGGPPLNPVEMNMPDKASVVSRIKENSMYVAAFKKFYGEDVFNNIDKAYLSMTKAIAEFEKTEQFAPFDSKWDRYLRGEYELSFMESVGKGVFFSPNNSSCVNCHMINDDKAGIRNPRQTFTNYKYFNIGVPENEALIEAIKQKGLHPEFIANKDRGLFDNPQVNDERLKGKFKVPTLRNVAVTAPYMHNGVFKELRTVLEFYDFRGTPNGRESRKINPETGKEWGETPFPSTIDHGKLAMQKLDDGSIDALECFLRTLTDKRFEDKLPPLREGLNCD